MGADLSLAWALAEQFEEQAEWWRAKAHENPDDAARSLGCAETFEKIARALYAFEGGPFYDRWCRLLETDGDRLDELLSEERPPISFAADDPEGLFESIVSRADEPAL